MRAAIHQQRLSQRIARPELKLPLGIQTHDRRALDWPVLWAQPIPVDAVIAMLTDDKNMGEHVIDRGNIRHDVGVRPIGLGEIALVEDYRLPPIRQELKVERLQWINVVFSARV